MGVREHWCEMESNNFEREHWWEDGSIQFWEGTLVGGKEHWCEVKLNNFGREH